VQVCVGIMAYLASTQPSIAAQRMSQEWPQLLRFAALVAFMPMRPGQALTSGIAAASSTAQATHAVVQSAAQHACMQPAATYCCSAEGIGCLCCCRSLSCLALALWAGSVGLARARRCSSASQVGLPPTHAAAISLSQCACTTDYQLFQSSADAGSLSRLGPKRPAHADVCRRGVNGTTSTVLEGVALYCRAADISRSVFDSLCCAGFTEPGATYRVDLAAEQPAPELFRQTKLKVPHDPSDYETKQVGHVGGYPVLFARTLTAIVIAHVHVQALLTYLHRYVMPVRLPGWVCPLVHFAWCMVHGGVCSAGGGPHGLPGAPLSSRTPNKLNPKCTAVQ